MVMPSNASPSAHGFSALPPSSEDEAMPPSSSSLASAWAGTLPQFGEDVESATDHNDNMSPVSGLHFVGPETPFNPSCCQIALSRGTFQEEQQEAVVTNLYDGLDLAASDESEPSLSANFPDPGSSLALIEDSSSSCVQKRDQAFDAFRYFWSFQREETNASGRPSPQITKKSGKDKISRVREVWGCGYVGRFLVDRLSLKSQYGDRAKDAREQIYIRRIPNLSLTGSTVIGPYSVIHRHSRAAAFSIYRSHRPFSGRQAEEARPSSIRTLINVRTGIMLAPKRVQEHYNSTKAMRKLHTYGLLDDELRGPKDRDGRGGYGQGTQTLSLRERDSRDCGRGRVLEGEDHDKNNDPCLDATEDAESSTATNSSGSTAKNTHPHVFAPVLPIIEIQQPLGLSSCMTICGSDSGSCPTIPISVRHPPNIDSVEARERELFSVSDFRHCQDHRHSDDLYDHLPLRTTHAQAFGALDSKTIENMRTRQNGSANADLRSTYKRFIHRFRFASRTEDHVSSTHHTAFQPPWITCAGRDQQEETDRTIEYMKARFLDMGLPHSNPRIPSNRAPKRRSSQNIFDQIPDGCLWMLLPLWPGETDTASVNSEANIAASFVAIPENRQYLLVYYVPFEEKPESEKPEKKKAKQSYSSLGGDAVTKNIYPSTFRVVARMVTYDELRLTGVRIPSDGLAINNLDGEAESSPLSTTPQDAQLTDTVVCECYGREDGFDFSEYGLLKLGLCTREEMPVQALSRTKVEREIKTMLTPVGRAVVEMIWLGCLAITGFGAI